MSKSTKIEFRNYWLINDKIAASLAVSVKNNEKNKWEPLFLRHDVRGGSLVERNQKALDKCIEKVGEQALLQALRSGWDEICKAPIKLHFTPNSQPFNYPVTARDGSSVIIYTGLIQPAQGRNDVQAVYVHIEHKALGARRFKKISIPLNSERKRAIPLSKAQDYFKEQTLALVDEETLFDCVKQMLDALKPTDLSRVNAY
jgi:hypothetical protein